MLVSYLEMIITQVQLLTCLQRAAHHMLYYPGSDVEPETVLLISPEETEDCLTFMRSLPRVAVHLLLYSAPVTRRMLHFNDLKYCAIPPLPTEFSAPMWLKVELGVLAGRLYFDFAEYSFIQAYLGLDGNADADDADEVEPVTCDVVKSGSQCLDKGQGMKKPANQELFTSKPMAFMHEWLTALRKESDISATPMAYVLSGKPLTANHSFFASKPAESVQKRLVTMR